MRDWRCCVDLLEPEPMVLSMYKSSPINSSAFAGVDQKPCANKHYKGPNYDVRKVKHHEEDNDDGKVHDDEERTRCSNSSANHNESPSPYNNGEGDNYTAFWSSTNAVGTVRRTRIHWYVTLVPSLSLSIDS